MFLSLNENKADLPQHTHTHTMDWTSYKIWPKHC